MYVFSPGLCGDYNMVLSDDMRTPQGIVEGTGTTFSNSWKTNPICPDRPERLDDPCSLSVENGSFKDIFFCKVKYDDLNTS